MSEGHKSRTMITFDHPAYEDHWASLNRARARIGQPPIPHGEPLVITVNEHRTPHHEPLGIGYCQQCGDLMLVNDEKQKWCPSCRAERKRYYIEKQKRQNPRKED